MISYPVTEFGKPLQRALRDTPVPTGTEVLIRVGSCGVCHSDAHMHDGYFDLGGGNKLDMTKSMILPRTMGHEIAGTVVAMGPDATGIAIGDQRVVFPWIGCGACGQCRAGREQLCNKPAAIGAHREGGFADHVVVPHGKYLLSYGALAQEQACTYACAGLTAYSALKKLAHVPLSDAAEPLLIIGAGGVGLSGIRLAKQMYGVSPIVVETDASKTELAIAAGASQLIDPTADGAARALVKATGGGVAAAIDFVGAGASFSFGYGALRKGGTMVSVGLMGGSATVVPAMLSMKALTVIGSYTGSLQEMTELMALAGTGVLPDLPLTTQPLDQVTQALDDLRSGKIRGRTILKP
jgi:D-arabinose 1-dehydrogenase-like Zn-dependent alcohol dehydrogenase